MIELSKLPLNHDFLSELVQLTSGKSEDGLTLIEKFRIVSKSFMSKTREDTSKVEERKFIFKVRLNNIIAKNSNVK